MKQEEINTVLAQLSQPELIALVKKMLGREPHLESLLPLVSKQQQITIQPEMYQRKIERIFRSGGDSWGATSSIADDLLKILMTPLNLLYSKDTMLPSLSTNALYKAYSNTTKNMTMRVAALPVSSMQVLSKWATGWTR